MEHYILSVWCGAESYLDASRNYRPNGGIKYDFFRFGCKRVETVRKYLRGYVEQAKLKGMEFLYPFFFREDGRYEIKYSDSNEILESGFIKDIIKNG